MSGGMILFPNYNDQKMDDEIDTDTCPLHYTVRPKKRDTYNKNSVINVQIAYIIAAVIWILIIFVMKLYQTNLIGWVILIIPLVVFAINYVNLTCVTKEVENEMLKGNFLSFAFLITIILINWSKIEDKGRYFSILLLSLILLMLSLVDIWVKPENMPLMRHLKTIFQTSALALLVYALFLYYTEVVNANTDKPVNVESTFSQ